MITDFEAYASAHGVTKEVFEQAGWSETIHKGRRALIFPTPGGERYRFLDNEGNKYESVPGYQRCWYRLDIALELAHRADLPLILCNGEASTIVAQYYGLPATCVTGGEKQYMPNGLIDQLRKVYPFAILFLAYDCDQTGRSAAMSLKEQFEQRGIRVYALDLGGENGYDLADWCRDTRPTDVFQLLKCPYLPDPINLDDSSDDDEEQSEGNEETATLIQQIAERFPWEEYAEEHYDELQYESRGEIRLLGNGGLFINPDRQSWYRFAEEVGGDVVSFVQYTMFGDNYKRRDYKGQWKEALYEAARIAKVTIPKTRSKRTLELVLESPASEDRDTGANKKESEEIFTALTTLGYTFRLNDMNDSIEVDGKPLNDVLRAEIFMRMRDEDYKNERIRDYHDLWYTLSPNERRHHERCVIRTKRPKPTGF